MSDYEQLGHMELVSQASCGENIGNTFYLPHHCVVKTVETESKFRVVFDGSAKSSTNISLNDCLLVGPTIQTDIYNLLLRFRAHNIILKADIGKMYRQWIWVDTSHRDLQRILWRPTLADPVREYRLTTVTYGTAAAPFLATRCLNQLAVENEDEFPDASRILKEDVYVDDLLSGKSTTAAAKNTQQQLQTIVSTAGLK
ncbi:unnamed protein product [Orchesella dallaii]|uniref:Reverse transcriptase domain-containing protein n=1 Tax=Orchesella dallaii TaxID=48710 RepID=A0ABP1RZA2_9HEXA